jgi:hypothetical protein
MEVFYPDWLANPVLVLKKNNTWRMCIDYTSLNKACPKQWRSHHRVEPGQPTRLSFWGKKSTRWLARSLTRSLARSLTRST